jgi:hypothetical protein
MFEQEYRSHQQISHEAAERSAIRVAIAERKAEAKRVGQQRRAARKAPSSVAEPA